MLGNCLTCRLEVVQSHLSDRYMNMRELSDHVRNFQPHWLFRRSRNPLISERLNLLSHFADSIIFILRLSLYLSNEFPCSFCTWPKSTVVSLTVVVPNKPTTRRRSWKKKCFLFFLHFVAGWILDQITHRSCHGVSVERCNADAMLVVLWCSARHSLAATNLAWDISTLFLPLYLLWSRDYFIFSFILHHLHSLIWTLPSSWNYFRCISLACSVLCFFYFI